MNKFKTLGCLPLAFNVCHSVHYYNNHTKKTVKNKTERKKQTKQKPEHTDTNKCIYVFINVSKKN
jgi:hypothetical protein